VSCNIKETSWLLLNCHCSYAQFQISDGVAGKAQAEANAVFVGTY
jgi:hypothetical protein